MKRLLAIIATATSLAHGGILLDWEYAFDGADIGHPFHTFFIRNVKVAPTGHSALEIINSFENTPRERRLLILDPTGQRTWLSDNLLPFVGEFESIRILQVAADSASFAVADDPISQLKLMMYNKNSTPDFSTRTLSNQKLAMVESQAGIAQLQPPTSFFGPNFVYTIDTGDGAGTEGIGVALRKYRLDSPASADVVVQSVSGTDSSNLVVKWDSSLNVLYQIQESTNMTDWSDVGQPITGTGAPMSWSAPIAAGARFYRITQR